MCGGEWRGLWGGDYANFTVINFVQGHISSDGSQERNTLIDYCRGCGVLHIYLLMNRLSGPRTTKYGRVNECLSDYGISVNITHALRRITFGGALRRWGHQRRPHCGMSHGGVRGSWRNVVLICMCNVLESQIEKSLTLICVCACAWGSGYLCRPMCVSFERAEDVGP